MNFPKFADFLKEKQNLEESINRTAVDYEKRLAEFRARFSDPAEAEEVVKKAGYASVSAFVSDPSDRKWSRLRIPGQGNYIR